MAYQKKVTGKASKKDKKYQIKQEKEIEIKIVNPGTDEYVVEILDLAGLPSTVMDGKKSLKIVWYNNFSVKKKKSGKYINQKFTVKLPGAKALKSAGKKIVIFDGTSNDGNPYIFAGDVGDNDTFELTNGDPAVGAAPP